MTTELRWAARTDVGRARDRNEDSYHAGTYIFAVADGLGGHNAGDVASKLAIEPMEELDRRADEIAPGRLAEALGRAVAAANLAVYERAQADAKVRGMGTTLTAVAISDGSAHLAHVGDSRCYLIRGGAMSQLSSDHTLVARMVADGKITAEQAEVHPQRSILTRALGAEPEVDLDTLELALAPGDRLLICSDGLSSVVPEERIRGLVADAKSLDEACKGLIDEANAIGGPDNITVIVIEAAGVPAGNGVAAPAFGGEVVRAGRPKRAGRRFPVRPLVWGLALVVLILGGWLGVRSWANRSFFVGIADGKVAIYRGLPASLGGIHLNHVEETTDIPVGTVQPYYRANLNEGIRAKTLREARDIVARVPRQPGATGTPTPTPSPAPT